MKSPHDQLMERAEKMARHIVSPPVAVRMMKEFVVRFGDLQPIRPAYPKHHQLDADPNHNGRGGGPGLQRETSAEFHRHPSETGEPWPEWSEEDAARWMMLIERRVLIQPKAPPSLRAAMSASGMPNTDFITTSYAS